MALAALHRQTSSVALYRFRAGSSRVTVHGGSGVGSDPAMVRTAIGLRCEDYGTHSLRRTKASIIYKATGNLRAVQLLLGHTKIESTVRYLGVDIVPRFRRKQRGITTPQGCLTSARRRAMHPERHAAPR